jgi:hypothetical protein
MTTTSSHAMRMVELFHSEDSGSQSKKQTR